jgi:invasion protein IalB
VKRGETKQQLLSVLVQRERKSNGLVLLLRLPHGLYLPAGVQYAVDRGQAKKLPIQTSDANGAYAGTRLTPDLLLDLKRGKTLTVRAVAANRKTLTIVVTLAGFTAAYEKLIAVGR